MVSDNGGDQCSRGDDFIGDHAITLLNKHDEKITVYSLFQENTVSFPTRTAEQCPSRGLPLPLGMPVCERALALEWEITSTS